MLARIESERYEAGTRQSEAAVQAAKAELDRAAADQEVAAWPSSAPREMHKERLVSDQAFDQAQADCKMRQAAVEAQRRRIAQLQAQLDSTRDDLLKTTVVSPMEGVVTSLPKEEGEVVIGAQSFSPTVIMTVADLSVMECEIMVDETDIRHLALGQPAEVRVDALEGIRIKGEVTEIGILGHRAGLRADRGPGQPPPAPPTRPRTSRSRSPSRTRRPRSAPGLNATADIEVARKENVLAAPIQAVVVREVDKDGKVVDPDAVKPGRAQPTPWWTRARPRSRRRTACSWWWTARRRSSGR